MKFTSKPQGSSVIDVEVEVIHKTNAILRHKNAITISHIAKVCKSPPAKAGDKKTPSHNPSL